MPSSFFNDTATTEIYTLSLHDALPISADKYLFTRIFQNLSYKGCCGCLSICPCYCHYRLFYETVCKLYFTYYLNTLLLCLIQRPYLKRNPWTQNNKLCI